MYCLQHLQRLHYCFYIKLFLLSMFLNPPGY